MSSAERAGPSQAFEASQATPSRRSKRPTSLASLLTVGTVVFMLLVGSLAGYLAFSQLYREKTTDVWALLYLQLEYQIHRLERALHELRFVDGRYALTNADLRAHPPTAVVAVSQTGDNLQLSVKTGRLGSRVKAKSLSFVTTPEERAPVMLWRNAGQDFFLRYESSAGPETLPYSFVEEGATYLLAWGVDFQSFMPKPREVYDGALVYAVNRSGSLIYTSDPQIRAYNLGSRPLVREFTTAPLTRGQLELMGPEGEPFYGIFAEVKDTNLVMFMEVPADVVYRPIQEMTHSFALVMTALLCGLVIVIQWPIQRIVTPLRQLIVAANSVGRGSLGLRQFGKSFGEVRYLAETFESMLRGLVERDRAIAQYVEEQKEAVRLQGELAVAQGIQETLVRNDVRPPGSGWSVAAHYAPAAECAGDWYSHYYDESEAASLVAIADVSGHGAGSAMFTAVIAGLFEQKRLTSPSFPAEGYLRELNRVIMTMGARKWHSTFTIVELTGSQVRITNAGATPIMRIKRGAKGTQVSALSLPSDVIGLMNDPVIETQTFNLDVDETLFLYTDGLIEARENGEGRQFGRRQLKRVLKEQIHLEPALLVNRMFAEFRRYIGETPAEDDVCLIALRKTA